MTLLGIDIGTTHCKAGLFGLDGTSIYVANRPMSVQHAPEGYAFFDPEQVWGIVGEIISEIAFESVMAIGISSMAESGLLIDLISGRPCSPIYPWFDTSAQSYADQIAEHNDSAQFYRHTGLHISYKASLAKLLWLKNTEPEILDNTVWLSVADYIAYRLTGEYATDYSLAGRTGAYDIYQKRWDAPTLEQWGLPSSLFPSACASGEIMGETTSVCQAFGIPSGIPVAISGHDHICAALVAQQAEPQTVFDSMGTAEVLIGAYPHRELSDADYQSGLLSGCHLLGQYNYWLGSLSSSGGAIEWLRGMFNHGRLSYADLDELVHQAGKDPTGILFFPYLLGSGAPHHDPLASGAWIGLRQEHTRAHLAKAMLEGTAFEIEMIRQAGVAFCGHPITTLIASGGGTRNRAWLQIKADISGCAIQVMKESEATLLGAAMCAGLGQNILTSLPIKTETIEPNRQQHQHYQSLFEEYVALQTPLRQFKIKKSKGNTSI